MAAPDIASTVTLRDYVRVIWLRKWLVVIVIVVCTATAFLFANSKTRMYEATALMMYQPSTNIANPLSTGSSTDVTTLALQVQSVVNMLRSPAVSDRARSLLPESDLRAQHLSVTAAIMPPDSASGSTVSDVVGVTAESTRPSVSAAAANAYAKAIIDLRVESERARLQEAEDAIRLQMERYTTANSKLTTDYLLLAGRLRDLQVAGATAIGGFAIIQPARAPDSPSSPKPLQSALIGFGVGLFAGVALAFIVSQFDTRVRSHRQAAGILGLSVVARVPRVTREVLRDGPLIALTDHEGGFAEALRVLRSNLEWTRVGGDVKSLMITSSQKGEGKTLVLCNLAVTLALAGKKVVLVDADLRDPRVHGSFSMSNEVGLSTVLHGSVALEDALRPFDVDRTAPVIHTLTASAAAQSTSQSGTLRILTSGPLPPNPGEFIASGLMAAVLKRLAESDVDYVLIDTPPVLAVGDSGALAPSIDGLLFVVNLNKTRQPTLEEGREALDALPCRKLGVVIVGDRPASSTYHRYGHTGHHGSSR